MEGSAPTLPSRKKTRKKKDPHAAFKANLQRSLATARLGYHESALKRMVDKLNDRITEFLTRGLAGLPRKIRAQRLRLSILPRVDWVVADPADSGLLLRLREEYEALFVNVQANKSLALKKRFARVLRANEIFSSNADPKQLFDNLICSRVMTIFEEEKDPDLFPVCNTIGFATGNKRSDEPYAVYLRLAWRLET